MAEPFDLDNQSSDPEPSKPKPNPPGQAPPARRPVPPPLKGQLPTSRASDLLRSKGTIHGSARGTEKPLIDIDRRATPFDDFASGLLAICGLIFLVGVGYLLFEMWSGNFADPNWNTVYTHDLRQQANANIQLCSNIMWCTVTLATVLFLFLFYHEDYVGYSLLAGALFMQLGIPYATGVIYQNTSHQPTDATSLILGLFSSQSWIIGIPGFILTAIHVFRATASGLEEAKLKRAGMKFGQKAVKDNKPRNAFLGPCWNLPYCKETIRSRCPIFVKKSGPCWRNKRGCMCDHTILLIAQSPNWKQSVNATVGKLEGKLEEVAMPQLPPQPQLSREAKNERCRQCVIFNYHQEQKYKLIVGLVVGGSLLSLVLYNQLLLDTTGNLFMLANNLVSRFSVTSHTTPMFPNGAPVFVEWLILSSVMLVMIAKVLQFAEWVCFRLKI